jgi:hypothetical protein
MVVPAAASPRPFMQHHSQRLSSAAVWDTAAICKKIDALPNFAKQQAGLLPSQIPPALAPTVAQALS